MSMFPFPKPAWLAALKGPIPSKRRIPTVCTECGLREVTWTPTIDGVLKCRHCNGRLTNA
jgi:hypothetical protein